MKRAMVVVGALLVGAAGAVIVLNHPREAQAMTPTPVSGYTIHIDAILHFAGHPNEVAHHWCKSFSPNLIECQLYDQDGPKGRIVGVETIVPTAVWKTFPASERRLWHYHRVEIPKVHPVTPDMTPAQTKALVASLNETYGKVFIFWDPQSTSQPVGQPTITILK